VSSIAYNVVTIPGRMTDKKLIQLKVLGEKVEQIAKELVPVDSGYLQRSINSYIVGNRLIIEALADYASYVENGSEKQEAQPFLQPAILAVADDIQRLVTNQTDAQQFLKDLNLLRTTLNIT
jgi:HK97 gp10 family phage protein